MPNRRRRRLSTALSTVAALAVASPVAAIAVSDSGRRARTAEHREFVQAASITDLPGELMSALSQGLSQFGINLPPLPTGLLTGTGSTPATTFTPGLGTPGLTAPGLTSPGLTAPSLTDPGLANPALTSPAGATPTLTDPALATPGLTTPV